MGGDGRVDAVARSAVPAAPGRTRPDGSARVAGSFRALLPLLLESHDGDATWLVGPGASADPGAAPDTSVAAGVPPRSDGEAPRIAVRTGDAGRDRLVEALAAMLPVIVDGWTDRQREIAHLVLVEGCRQVDVATRLVVSRPTVSVAVRRARLREVDAYLDALDEELAGRAARDDGAPPAVRRVRSATEATAPRTLLPAASPA